MSSTDGVPRPNTLVFLVPEQLRSGGSDAFFAKLLAALDCQISCVQFMPGYYVRVSFKSVQSRYNVFRDGIVIDHVKISFAEADPTVCSVYLHHCPFEVSNDVISGVFDDFGDVMSVESVCHPGSDVLTGSRLIKMSVVKEIPSKLRVLRYPCRVWYRGQITVL